MIDKEKILALAAEELADANTKHPPTFSSGHEAYAVILEELEEAALEFNNVADLTKKFWNDVKEDLDTDEALFEMQEHAIYAVQEMIQVIAMCDKAMNMKGGVDNGK